MDATPSVAQVVAELDGRDLFLRHPAAPTTAAGAHALLIPRHPVRWPAPDELAAMTRQPTTAPRDVWSADPDRTTRRWASA